MNVLRIIKINFLALLAFPLLLLATAVKLLAKSLEKLLTVIGTILVIGGIALIFELAKNPGEFFQGFIMLILCLVLGGIFSALIIWILSMISSGVMKAVSLVIGVINSFYELLYAGYAGLYHICYEDYCKLSLSNNAKRGGCFIYSLLRVFNKVIIFVATHAIKLLVAICVFTVGYSIVSTNSYIQSVFGMNLFAYLKLFPVYEIIYGVVLYLAFLVGFIILLVSLGIEWSEWGEEMSLSTSEYEKYIQNVKSGYITMSQERLAAEDAEEKRLKKCRRYMELLNHHMETFEEFLEEIQPIAKKSEDYILRANHGQYITDLHEITQELNKYEGQVPLEAFEKLIPRIDQLDKVKNKIEKQVQQIRENKEAKTAVAAGFFSGCDSTEKLEKRYKALCKTYHPDAEAGDEETFKLMQDEYENRKKELAKE